MFVLALENNSVMKLGLLGITKCKPFCPMMQSSTLSQPNLNINPLSLVDHIHIHISTYSPETPAITVNEFTSSTKPVTNAKFAAFFHDGGYRLKEFWVESNEFAVDVVRAEDKDDDPSKSWTWV